MKRMLIFSPVIFISYLVSLSIYGHDVMKVMVSPLNDYITDLPNVILMISLALFFFAVLFALAVAFVIVYLVSYSLTKPLREMSAAAKQYATGDFSKRISTGPMKEYAARTFPTVLK